MRPAQVLAAIFLLSVACSSGRTPEQPGDSAEPSSLENEAEPEIIGIEWRWVESVTPEERTEVARPERYTLRLEPDGQARMQFDCNSGGGGYELAGSRLSFGPMISTRMACPPDTQDIIYMRQLDEITSFFVRNGELYLEMPADGGTMRFRRASAGE